MAEKSKSWFLTLKTEDPASNAGIISLYKVKRLKNEEKPINKDDFEGEFEKKMPPHWS